MFDSDPYDEWMETIVSYHLFLVLPWEERHILCHEPWFSSVTFGYIHSSGMGRILTIAHRTNSARTCNASRLRKRFTCIVRRRERSRGQGPSSEHFVTSIHICQILQKRANRILMPASNLDFTCGENERDAVISAKEMIN